MSGPPLLLADANRAEEFLLLGATRRLFDGYTVRIDSDGIAWATKAIGGHGFALTWLGPGWMFDPVAQERRAEDVQTRRAALQSASPERHQQELDVLIAKLRLGHTAERLLWLIHQQVLRLRSSLLYLPDELLADAVWGPNERPTHWRKDLLSILQRLTWLHLTHTSATEGPVLGAKTAILTHVTDLRGTVNDVCQDGCSERTASRHHHYLINVGRGFLGILEKFAQEEVEGVRSYAFPIGGRRKESHSLRKAGKSGGLVTIYLPAKLGDRKVCDELTVTQHRLLQAIVRETTRNTKTDRRSVSEAEVLHGNIIPTIDGKEALVCALLDPEGAYVGFNGNRLLKGRGYLLLSPGGWLARSGYSPGQVSAFFADLHALATKLALIPVGIERNSPICLNVPQMSARTASPHGMNTLRRLHLRVYAPADYLDRWNGVFHWDDMESKQNLATDPVLTITSALKAKVVSQRQLAQGMGVDPSLLSKVLRGKRSWPEGWLTRATSWLNSQIAAKDPGPQDKTTIPQ
jgi:hypothetical protein